MTDAVPGRAGAIWQRPSRRGVAAQPDTNLERALLIAEQRTAVKTIFLGFFWRLSRSLRKAELCLYSQETEQRSALFSTNNYMHYIGSVIWNRLVWFDPRLDIERFERHNQCIRR